MIQVIALIYAGVNGEEGIRAYEEKALAIVTDHGGELISASKPLATASSFAPLPDEIHVLVFPGQDALAEYKNDPRHQQLKSIKDGNIDRVELITSIDFLEY